MLKKIAVALLIVVVIVVAALLILMKGPDVSQYEPLREPRITTLQDQKMVVVEAKGDPNAVGRNAFGLLFKTYYKIEGAAKGPKQPAPRARWSGDMKNKSTWIGRYALPVPEQTTSLPRIEGESGLRAELVTWEYGTVAEILHVGPYADEVPTIERLKQFISKNGYHIIGDHEEEYVKGPGMFFKGDPDKYYTIIRLRIAKARS